MEVQSVCEDFRVEALRGGMLINRDFEKRYCVYMYEGAIRIFGV